MKRAVLYPRVSTNAQQKEWTIESQVLELKGQIAASAGNVLVKEDEQVREFAERMVQDHTAANQQLVGLAEAADNTPPTEMDQKHHALHQQLSQLSGEEFDRQYMQGQVQDHQAAVELFSTEANQPTGPVDQLAGELLPTLREHLQMAQEISDSIM